MIFYIAVQEMLQRVVAVESDSYETAVDRVRKAYDEQRIVLNADDLQPDMLTGESASFLNADWLEIGTAEELALDLLAG